MYRWTPHPRTTGLGFFSHSRKLSWMRVGFTPRRITSYLYIPWFNIAPFLIVETIICSTLAFDSPCRSPIYVWWTSQGSNSWTDEIIFQWIRWILRYSCSTMVFLFLVGAVRSNFLEVRFWVQWFDETVFFSHLLWFFWLTF